MLKLMTKKSANTILHYGETENSLHYVYHNVVVSDYEKFLEHLGVKLPKWGTQSAAALSLLVVAQLRGEMFHKKIGEQVLNNFGYLRECQEFRHLGRQNGFNIEQYSQLRARGFEVSRGVYYLVNLTETYKGFVPNRHDCETVKHLNTPCKRCGGMAGYENRLFGGIIQYVSMTHADPGKSLKDDDNVLLCDICNRTLMNRFVFNSNGYILHRYQS